MPPLMSWVCRQPASVTMPWMMLEGTPGAHLMIAINGTALSNQPN